MNTRLLSVVPAKAGTHLALADQSKMDPGLRRDDEGKLGVRHAFHR